MRLKEKAKLLMSGLLGVIAVSIFNPTVEAVELPEIEAIQATKSQKNVEQLVNDLPKNAHLDDPFLILTNPENELSSEPSLEELVEVDNQQYIHSKILDPYQKLVTAAHQAGHQLINLSGFRSKETQKNNRLNSIRQYMFQGIDYQTAVEKTNQYIAPSEASEHSTGLAVDILGTDWTQQGGGLTAGFSDTASGQWLKDHAHQYGFILRYPLGKEDITSYGFEPWHFRYVGRDHATFMYDHGLTLEEYLTLLQARDS